MHLKVIQYNLQTRAWLMLYNFLSGNDCTSSLKLHPILHYVFKLYLYDVSSGKALFLHFCLGEALCLCSGVLTAMSVYIETPEKYIVLMLGATVCFL